MKTLYKLARLCAAVLVLALGLASPTHVAHATVGATLTVNSNSDADNGSDGVCTLREAIIASMDDSPYNECSDSSGNGYGDDYINFSISGSTTITLGAALPVIATGRVTIDGSNGGRPIIIDGAGAYQVFNVGGSATVTLGNLTVQNGHSGGSGGGVANAGILVVLRSTFQNNSAVNDGGAILNTGAGGLNIANSTFTGNSASYGGGLAVNGGTANIFNSTFSGNTASTHGGALSQWNSPVTTVYNTILANSTAPEDCYNGFGGISLTGDHNIIETDAAGASTCSTLTPSIADPNLGMLTGSPAYFPLNAGSPAIDAGDNTTCAGPPVNGTSQNGIPRPQDGNKDTIRTCDIGSYEKPVTVQLRSNGALDGWVLESSETSSLGGSTRDALGPTLRLGDDAGDRQYRAILSFATASLPDTAVITKITLKLKKASVTGGGNPVTILQGFQPDVQRGFFGSASALESADFQVHTTATKTVSPIIPALVSGWYTLNITGAKAYINKLSTKGGVTQVRLRFKLDDNDNLSANFLSLYSGNATTAANRPLLTVVYYVP